MQSLFKKSSQFKESLKYHSAQATTEKARDEEVKAKLRRLPAFEDTGENELSTWVNWLTDKEQLHKEFTHLYDHYDVADTGTTEVTTHPNEADGQTTAELQTGAKSTLQCATQIPVCLYYSDLQSCGEAGTAGTGVTTTLAAALDFEYGAHHAAVMIGDVVVEWDASSLVQPRQKGVQPVFCTSPKSHHSHWLSRVLKAQTDTMAVTAQHESYGEQIKFTIELNAEKTQIDNLIEVIIRHNKYFYYHVFSRNCQHFVLDVMEALGLTEPPTFTGRMRKYYEMLRKGRRSELPNEFPSHENLDDYITRNLQSLRPDDLEYFLCQYYGFHHKAVQEQGQDKPSESHCPIRTCQMKKLDERIAQDSVQLRIHNYTRV